MNIDSASHVPALCPHCGHNLVAERPVAIGALRYDPVNGASWQDEPVRLSSAEQLLFGSLVHARGAAVGRLALRERIDSEAGGNVIDVLVSRIRRALRAAGAPDCIRTCRRVGYALDIALLEETAPCP